MVEGRAASKALKSGGLGGTLLDQSLNGRGRLGADTQPMGQTVLHNAQTFLTTFCDRIVKADAFDEPAVATNALVRYNNIEKWTMLGTAA
jgi:hypothetical protein